ncbi:hypothetical protein [Streptomyces sp. NPDC017993]|uniref:hypothetical protein n=1 Tax=Streptomyces sp. NPDC017993 TaxID=3365027 RepID=UPI0037A0AE6B
MGWTVLYIAFGLVALWLLGEVLLQYKARLRWRLLAFAGFLGVVLGVIIPSVIVIGLGAIAFAVGQTQVTLSFRRGFSTGWALGGKPGESRRRRARSSAPPAAEPTLQVSDLEAVPLADAAGAGADDTAVFPGQNGAYAGRNGEDVYQDQNVFVGSYGDDTLNGPLTQETYAGDGFYNAGDGYRAHDPYQDQQQTYAGQDAYARHDTAVYAPQPMPDETGQYGIYSPDARNPQGDYPEYPDYPGYDAYGNATGNATGNGDGNGYGYGGSYGQPAAGQDAYADPYGGYGGYGDGQGQQAPYSDPYIGTQQYSAPYDPYAQPDPYGGAPYAQQYDGLPSDGQGQPLGQDFGQGYHETPPGGAWVPQQRDGELPPEQPPYPPNSPQGYDEQHYRY